MRRARVVQLERTCGHAPSQWEGLMDDGRHVFIHYRQGHGSIGVGATLDEAVDATLLDSDGWHWNAAPGDDPAFLSNGDMLAVLHRHFDYAPGLLAGQPGWT